MPSYELKYKNIVWLSLPLQQIIAEQAKRYNLAVNVYIAKLIELAVNDEDFMRKVNDALKVFARSTTNEDNKWQNVIQYIKALKEKGIVKHSKLQMAYKLGLTEEDFKKMLDHGLIVMYDNEWVYLE